MRKRIQRPLREIAHAGQANNKPVHLSERGEAECFRGVVADSGVVEGAVEDEEGDVCVGGPGVVFEEAQGADGGGDGDEDGKGCGRARVVEEEADEGDACDTAEGEGEVEEGVYASA